MAQQINLITLQYFTRKAGLYSQHNERYVLTFHIAPQINHFSLWLGSRCKWLIAKISFNIKPIEAGGFHQPRASFHASSFNYSSHSVSGSKQSLFPRWMCWCFQAPEGESQPSTEVDLFISTEKIMVLNTDLKVITSHNQSYENKWMKQSTNKVCKCSVKGISSFPESKEYH